MLLNLFLAILLENFEEMDEEQAVEEATEEKNESIPIKLSLVDILKASFTKITKRSQVLALPADEGQSIEEGAPGN